MQYSIISVSDSSSWVAWIHDARYNPVPERLAPYTDLNTAYRCKEYWWPASYKDFEVREISEADIARLKKEI